MLAALGLAGWEWYYPHLARQVATIPALVRVRLQRSHGTYTPPDRISPLMEEAIVAIEDRRFYQNHGIDLHGMARALWEDVSNGNLGQGGATITDQLVENTLVPHHTLMSAPDILALAWVTEDRFSKQQILALYLNAIYYGRHAYGIASAAQTYFGTDPQDLTLNQAAFLAALPQAPTYYGTHPYAPETVARRETVIRDMEAQGYITPSQEQLALQTQFRLTEG